MPATGIACESCPAFVRDPAMKTPGGYCHNAPPTPFPMVEPNALGVPTIFMKAAFPAVGVGDWCMQHPLATIAMPIDSRLAVESKGEA